MLIATKDLKTLTKLRLAKTNYVIQIFRSSLRCHKTCHDSEHFEIWKTTCPRVLPSVPCSGKGNTQISPIGGCSFTPKNKLNTIFGSCLCLGENLPSYLFAEWYIVRKTLSLRNDLTSRPLTSVLSQAPSLLSRPTPVKPQHHLIFSYSEHSPCLLPPLF